MLAVLARNLLNRENLVETLIGILTNYICAIHLHVVHTSEIKY